MASDNNTENPVNVRTDSQTGIDLRVLRQAVSDAPSAFNEKGATSFAKSKKQDPDSAIGNLARKGNQLAKDLQELGKSRLVLHAVAKFTSAQLTKIHGGQVELNQLEPGELAKVNPNSSDKVFFIITTAMEGALKTRGFTTPNKAQSWVKSGRADALPNLIGMVLADAADWKPLTFSSTIQKESFNSPAIDAIKKLLPEDELRDLFSEKQEVTNQDIIDSLGIRPGWGVTEQPAS